MKFIELFAGIGAFRLGLERTGHECVYANEIQPKARSIYEKQFGDSPDPRDIRDIHPGQLPKADLIVGGFPCATFSVAGKRSGFSLSDTRGTLAFEMFRLASGANIPYILFENVKGLLNHDGGRTFRVILEVLDQLGYDCQWELLDSFNFGVPQHRERIFLVGSARGEPRLKVFPLGGSEKKDAGETAQDIEVHQWRRGYFRKFKSNGVPTLTANMGLGGHNVPFLKFPNGDMRKLTPLECERLQGLPDMFTAHYSDGSKVSDSERYERTGRTITIPIVEAIGRKLHV
jgi:DNA (cytosine-5)-methyltransferase 1